jgi:uncharacterized metal-binding protein YceD (DUF177 family)
MKKDIAPEFSRTLVVEKIPPSGMEQKLTAKDDERKALADRFGLLELPLLEAQLTVKPAKNKSGITVTGTLRADVVQQCGVTLEPLPSHIEEPVEALFTDIDPDDVVPASATLIEAGEDEVDPIINGMIDIGELVAQHLGASLDPFPRKPGLAYVEVEYGGKDSAPNPFAKLAQLPKDQKD